MAAEAAEKEVAVVETVVAAEEEIAEVAATAIATTTAGGEKVEAKEETPKEAIVSPKAIRKARATPAITVADATFVAVAAGEADRETAMQEAKAKDSRRRRESVLSTFFDLLLHALLVGKLTDCVLRSLVTTQSGKRQKTT